MNKIKSLILTGLASLLTSPAAARTLNDYRLEVRFTGVWELKSRLCIIPAENKSLFRQWFPRMDEYLVIPRQREILALSGTGRASLANRDGSIRFHAEFAILNNGTHLAFRNLPPESETYLRSIMKVHNASISHLTLHSKAKNCAGYVQSRYGRYVRDY